MPKIPRSLSRRGGVAVEMILVVVVLVTATVGLVHFGVFFANIQQVALAARAGALEASQLVHLPTTDSAAVPQSVLDAVSHQLESSKIAYCKIRLEHNAVPTQDPVVLASPSDDACDCLTETALDSSPGIATAQTRYVRLTVCVPLSEVFPQTLSFFGSQLYGSEQTYEQTAIYRYEVEMP